MSFRFDAVPVWTPKLEFSYSETGYPQPPVIVGELRREPWPRYKALLDRVTDAAGRGEQVHYEEYIGEHGVLFCRGSINV